MDFVSEKVKEADLNINNKQQSQSYARALIDSKANTINKGADDGLHPLKNKPQGSEDIIRRQHQENCRLQYGSCLGDQLDSGENICGAILSIRFNEDIVSIWNHNASDHQAVMALRDAIKRNLKLPHSYVIEYKLHDASLCDNSSYRNTWLRG